MESVEQTEVTNLPSIQQLLHLVRFRRSIRAFEKDQDVSEETVRSILETARWSPSGANCQPWEFIVIRDAEMRNRIADLYVRQLEDKKEMEKAVRGYVRLPGPAFRNAPVLILLIGDPRGEVSYPVRTILDKGERHFVTGMANAAYAIHLAAAALGLGSQYVSDAGSPYMATMLKVMLGIPEIYHVYELIPIGYTKRRPPETLRRPLDEMIHTERFDAAKFRTDEQMKTFLATQTRAGAYGKAEARPDWV